MQALSGAKILSPGGKAHQRLGLGSSLLPTCRIGMSPFSPSIAALAPSHRLRQLSTSKGLIAGELRWWSEDEERKGGPPSAGTAGPACEPFAFRRHLWRKTAGSGSGASGATTDLLRPRTLATFALVPSASAVPLRFSSSAKFILVVEKDSVFQVKLVEHAVVIPSLAGTTRKLCRTSLCNSSPNSNCWMRGCQRPWVASW